MWIIYKVVIKETGQKDIQIKLYHNIWHLDTCKFKHGLYIHPPNPTGRTGQFHDCFEFLWSC